MKSKEEILEFLEWCHKERENFNAGMTHDFDWYNLSAKQRVIVENFIICFDQLLDQNKQYSDQFYTRAQMIEFGEKVKSECASQGGMLKFVKQSILSINIESLLQEGK